jgi:hypothetical protein
MVALNQIGWAERLGGAVAVIGSVQVEGTIPVEGQVDVGDIEIQGSIKPGKVVVGTPGTAVRFITPSTPLVNYVSIKALATNGGFIYIGDASVDKDNQNGYQLAAGEELIAVVPDLNMLYLDGDVSGEGIVYFGT